MKRLLLAAVVLALQVEPARAQRVGLGPPEKWDTADAATAERPVSALGTESTRDPALDFVLNCRGCHRADGLGTPGAVPELAGSMARFLSVAGGREYLARVPGVAQSALDDAALAALLNWMLVRFDPEHVPADFRPFTATEIAVFRRDPLVEASRRRVELLAGLADPSQSAQPAGGISQR